MADSSYINIGNETVKSYVWPNILVEIAQKPANHCSCVQDRCQGYSQAVINIIFLNVEMKCLSSQAFS